MKQDNYVIISVDMNNMREGCLLLNYPIPAKKILNIWEEMER